MGGYVGFWQERVDMKRFWTKEPVIVNKTIVLTGEEAQHIKVSRLFEEDFLIITNGDGFDYKGIIKKIEKKNVIVHIKNKKENLNENNIQTVLYQAMLKSDKMDFVIQKSVELGVGEIVPMITKRTIVKEKNMSHKLLRWQKIILEACKQCERAVLPTITEVMTIAEAIEDSKRLSLPLLLDEDEDNRLFNVSASVGSLGIFVGPEGGFSDEERQYFKENNIQSYTLGKRILRAETAGMAALSMVNYIDMHNINK